jgi:putative transposase
MNLTVKIKLLPSEDQKQMLRDTMKAFNEACNYVSDVAYKVKTASQVRLHHECYYSVREQFGLSAQMAVRAIGKVVESLRRDRAKHHLFKPYGAIVLDNRLLSFKGMDRVSILTLQGRQIMPFACGEYGQQRLIRVRGQADLVLIDGKFYLLQNCVMPDPEIKEATDFLGVDLGIVNIASDSDGEVYSGAQVNGLRRRHAKLRAKLQSKGTKSAKRLLRKRRRKEALFTRDINHRISKHIVAKAKDTDRGIALEDLKGIRSRTTVRKAQRRTHDSWSFYQLRSFMEYKAKLAGVQTVAVDPRNTSRTCPRCGSIDKRNRPTQSLFHCRSCDFSGPADIIAAGNISARAAINKPNVGRLQSHLQTACFSGR